MTGSLDLLGIRYAAVDANQAHRVELIQDAQQMASELLKQFKLSTTKDPKQIIYLRDGVSEGQFSHVLQQELAAIRKAADAFTKVPVKIAVIIAKKRHHTRFFPTGPTTPRKENVQPGTVVETGVTHPSEFDFCTIHLWLC